MSHARETLHRPLASVPYPPVTDRLTSQWQGELYTNHMSQREPLSYVSFFFIRLFVFFIRLQTFGCFFAFTLSPLTCAPWSLCPLLFSIFLLSLPLFSHAATPWFIYYYCSCFCPLPFSLILLPLAVRLLFLALLCVLFFIILLPFIFSLVNALLYHDSYFCFSVSWFKLFLASLLLLPLALLSHTFVPCNSVCCFFPLLFFLMLLPLALFSQASASCSFISWSTPCSSFFSLVNAFLSNTSLSLFWPLLFSLVIRTLALLALELSVRTLAPFLKGITLFSLLSRF